MGAQNAVVYITKGDQLYVFCHEHPEPGIQVPKGSIQVPKGSIQPPDTFLHQVNGGGEDSSMTFFYSLTALERPDLDWNMGVLLHRVPRKTLEAR